MKILKAVWNYLRDWKNLLTHGLIGIAILLVAMIIPVAPIFRLLILAVAVGFNLIRMDHTKKFLNSKE